MQTVGVTGSLEVIKTIGPRHTHRSEDTEWHGGLHIQSIICDRTLMLFNGVRKDSPKNSAATVNSLQRMTFHSNHTGTQTSLQKLIM